MAILGAGYVGRRLYVMLRQAGRRAWVTSRHPTVHLSEYPPDDRIEFDLAREETWKHIPPGVDLVWCFPATPAAQVTAFMSAYQAVGRLVVLGSTAAYVPGPDGQVDEGAALDLTRPRVQGEEWLRTRCRAIVLRLAGIYGPGRNPLDWLRQGRVTCSDRFVNLIHREDVVQICGLALERAQPGQVYTVSDGRPRRWRDICRTAQERWQVIVPAAVGEESTGKRVLIRKLLDDFAYQFRYPDLYAALEELERNRSRPPTEASPSP